MLGRRVDRLCRAEAVIECSSARESGRASEDLHLDGEREREGRWRLGAPRGLLVAPLRLRGGRRRLHDRLAHLTQ